jgi:uncharacterized UPF0160 family protein
MKIVTHSDSYHTDDVFAVATLLLVYPEAEVVRSRDREVMATADILVDVGLEYDPEKLRFDHHQSEGAGKRENGIPYASFGLVWKQYGEQLAGSREASQVIDEVLVMPIDAIDNGVEISTSIFPGIRSYSIGDYLASFSNKVNDPGEINRIFGEVVILAKELLLREINSAMLKVGEWNEVRRIYENSSDKKIIILPNHISWKKVLIQSEAMYVISERLDKTWQVRAVPIEFYSMNVKKSFPEEWGGLEKDKLSEISNVSDATFCHRGLFLAGATTKEGAIRLAEIALNA